MTNLTSPSFPRGLPEMKSEAQVRAERADKFICPRCRVELEDADEAEGCEDLQCPLIGGMK